MLDGQLADALLDPGAYPWSPPEVRRIDTHVSHIFVAGDRVVKIKRPVNLGFLNFSQPETRRAACIQEDRLNRRLTRGVYLGVTPITARGNGVEVGGRGPIVEYAVVMRRLPERRMLDQLIASGLTPPEAGDAIADHLIPFHLAARRCGPTDALTCAQVQLRVLLENVNQLHSLILPTPQCMTEIVIGAMLRAIDVLADQVRDRCRGGFVVDGHGDLRADHICFDGDRPQIFDCIEFDAALRCADIASDLSFLLMDLKRIGGHGLAAALLNRYLSAGVALPESLLRLYTAHRALVRVKVGLIEQAEGIGENLARSIADHLDVASAALTSARPVLISVSGPSGSGKSHVAARIARALGIELLQSDALRQELVPSHDAATRYHPDRVAAVYAELRLRAATTLARGKAVILDATFLDPGERDRAAALAAEAGAPFILVRVRASDATALRRIRARAKSEPTLSDADEAVFYRQRAAADAADDHLPGAAIALDIDNDADGPPKVDSLFATLAAAGLLTDAITG